MFAPKNWWWVSKPILVIDLGPYPTLGRSISFPCSQLQCAAQEVTMSMSVFLRQSMCSLIFTLDYSKQNVSPVFHQCFTSVSQMFHKCFNSVLPMFHKCFNIISPQVFHQCFTSILLVFNQCFTSTLPVFQQCFTNVS